MAKMLSLRLRRALTSLSPTLHCSLTPTPAISAPLSTAMHSSEPAAKSAWHPGKLLPSRNFRSSATLMLSARSSRGGNFVDDDKIDPDMVLFEGCDYNHWLITMDFPKDPKPTPEEMVRTYEETCAKGLNISLEEAKKRMYACSTTTYQGFQAVMTEAESEQFRGLPGVVFILPDSYIDPQNKEYGGDKYENGVITHRPPPIQYSPRGRRHNNRNFDQPRYDRQGGGSNPLSNRQGSQYNHPGTPQSNYGAPQNYAPHQHGHPTREGERGNSMPLNDRVQYYSPGGSDIPQRRDAMPPYQGNYGHQVQNNYYGQGPGGNRVNYAPPGQSNPMGGNGNFVPTPGGPYGQDAYGVQGSGTNYGQGTYSNMQGNTAPGESQWSKQDDQGNTRGDHRGYAPMEQRGAEQMRRN